MIKKPSKDEILEQFRFCRDKVYPQLYEKYKEDEKFYECDFKDSLNIPNQFKPDRVVLSTARDVVDVAVNHTDIMNARVFVNKKGTSDIAGESAEMLRKLGLGIIHQVNVESRIAPGHVAAKHYWIHGLGVIKTVWDADRWIDKPPQKEGESNDNYALRIDDWRAETHLSLPLVIQAINPANIIPDPYTNGDLYVMEYHKRLLFDVMRTKAGSRWGNPRKIPQDEEVEYLSFWDKDFRCDLIDGEPVWKMGVFKHKYGFIPYTLIESGLGNLSQDAAPEKRYVGLLRYIIDLLISESTNYSLNDILMKRETMKGGWITGVDAKKVANVKQEYGKYWPVGDTDAQFHDWETKLAPQESYQHLALTHDYIAGHAAPRSVRGLSETGVRSGADRRLVMAEAAAIYRYSSPAFAHGWAQILNKCARLIKNVIPGDVDVWTRTPSDEFDIPIKKSLLKEPFNFTIEFAPISEEDEFRRMDNLRLMVQSGIYTPEFAWTQMSNVDPKKMAKDVEKAKLRMLPAYNQMKDQMMATLLQQATMEAGLQPSMSPQTEGIVPGTPQGSERRMSPNVPNRAPLGSIQDMQNKLKSQRSPVPAHPGQGQGLGAGGNR